MQELNDSGRRKSHSPKVCHLITHRLWVKHHITRVLHPGVSDQDPYGRDRCSNDGEPRRGEVEALAHFPPTEEHHRYKGGLHEEG